MHFERLEELRFQRRQQQVLQQMLSLSLSLSLSLRVCVCVCVCVHVCVCVCVCVCMYIYTFTYTRTNALANKKHLRRLEALRHERHLTQESVHRP